MKRSLALACLFASSLSFAATTTVTSGNTFGVLRVEVGTDEEVIIAIPWLAASTDNNSAIKVTDVIKTANLTEGDQLYYYNTESKKYQVWQLNSSKEWVEATDVSSVTTETTSSDTTLKRGNAILLKRPTDKADSIYLYGQVPSDSSCTVEMAQGSSAAPAYTLIAPPAVSATDLNSATWANVADGDVIVLDVGTVLNYVTIDGTKKWAKKTYNSDSNTDTFETTAATISAGQGAWYVSRGGSSAATVTW